MKGKFVCTLFVLIGHFTWSQKISFEDDKFLGALLQHNPKIDLNDDQSITQEEVNQVSVFKLSGFNLVKIDDLKHFKNLVELVLTNNAIDTLVLTNLPKLKTLYCAKNVLTHVSLTNLPSLENLGLGRNKLDRIYLENLPELTSLNLMNNKISYLDLSSFKKLKYLSVDGNRLTNLDISNNTELIQFVISDNSIKEIDISKNTKLNLNILYRDSDVKFIGTAEQLKSLKALPQVIEIGN